MKQLKRVGDNLGGVLRMWAIPPSVISVLGKTVTISDNTNVYELVCSETSKKLDQQPEKTSAGTAYNNVVAGFLSKQGDDLIQALNYMDNRKWVVLVIDGNELPLLVGTATTPLHFEGTLVTGSDTPDRAGLEFRFYGKTTSRAVVVDNPF